MPRYAWTGAWCALLAGWLAAGCTGPDGNEDAADGGREREREGAFEVAQPSQAEHTYTNRLIDETSPYLLQHAHNPVDWYPWGEEAFAKARAENKPIFLSVGYSSCHWCHVMERESFENEAVAEILNAHFVSIKVDREERPDVDEIYMTAVQAMTGSGGWPMSVFLTPELEPFYGGTYFPPEDAYGRPGFKTLLTHLAAAWRDKHGELVESAGRLTDHMRHVLASVSPESGALSYELIDKAVHDLQISFDAQNGGWGDAPKFPSAPTVALLLRTYDRTGDANALHMATTTLDKMARGGMYDHLGGGFARYSTDSEWLVPHFEKMLYDNAQLAQIYLEAYQLTKKPLYREVAEETLDYVLRDMRDERGGFHSAEDADSEGEEGKFYIWTYDEIAAALDGEDAELFIAYYNVKPHGNFSSHEPYHAQKNILHTPRDVGEVAEEFNLSVEDAKARIDALRAKLLELRNARVRPGLDDKVLTAWNALMITAFAQAYPILGDERYKIAAEEAAAFVLEDMMRDGDLLRTHRHGESRIPAYLDDYAYMAAALADVYEATFDVKWLDAANGLTETMIEKFWDTASGGFYYTGEEHANLIVRTRPTYDGAVPSGNSVAAYALLRLAKFLDNPEYYGKAKQLMESNGSALRQVPRGYLKMLLAADFLLTPPKEIAIAGTRGSADVDALFDALYGTYVPNKVVAFVDPESPEAAALGEKIPLLEGKAMVSGNAAAYVCRDFACKLPVTTPEALLEQLGVRSGDV